MSTTGTSTEEARPDGFTYETIKVECKVTRTLVASIATGGFWETRPGMYSRDRTSTKNILSTTRKFTSDFPTTVESGLSAGESFPIEIVDVEGEVSQSAALTFAEGFEESTRIENSYETDTEVTFEEEPVEKTIKGLDNYEKIIYEEKSFYDELEVTSNLLTTFKEGWKNMERKEIFTVEVDVGVSYKWFHLETPGGYRLSIPENDAEKSKGKSLIVLDKTEEAGQLWRWDGKCLSSKLGGVMAIARDGTNRGADVVTCTKRPEMGQQWEINGKHIKSQKEGLYLAVRHGGKGSKVCVWTKNDEEEQHWFAFAEGSAEGDFETKFFSGWKKPKWIPSLPKIPKIDLPVIVPPFIDDIIDDIASVVDDGVDFVDDVVDDIKSVGKDAVDMAGDIADAAGDMALDAVSDMYDTINEFMNNGMKNITFDGFIVTSIDYKEEPIVGRPNRITFAGYTPGNEAKMLSGKSREKHNEELKDSAAFLWKCKHIGGKDIHGERKYEADKLTIDELHKEFAKKYGEDSAPLFAIHGYCNEPGYALYNANKAQKKFNGSKIAIIPIIWPNYKNSAGLRYFEDRGDNAPEAVKELKMLFDSTLGTLSVFKRKNFFAHSLGNYVLRGLASEKLEFDNIFMVAADVPNNIFDANFINKSQDKNSDFKDGLRIFNMLSKHKSGPKKGKPKGKIYCLHNKSDFLLSLSSKLHSVTKLGQSGISLKTIHPDIDGYTENLNVANENTSKGDHSYMWADFSIEFYKKKIDKTYSKLPTRIIVGKSSSNSKRVKLPHANMTVSPIPVNKQHSTWRDTFKVSVSGNILTVTRTDSKGGWGQPLHLLAKPSTMTNKPTPSTTTIVGPGIVAIRSVSSGNYLDGRTPKHIGIQIHLTNRTPKGDRYLHWTLTKLSDGTYNMRSISSKLFVDGRDPQHKGRQVKLRSISETQASSSHYFKWRITDFTYGGHTRVAIQSVSSGLYLDGRNPNHTGNQLYLTARNPQGDKYLMWDLESMEEEASFEAKLYGGFPLW